MAILAECPICRKKQAVKNKRCPCGENLDKAKRSNRVRYWIVYRLPNKKQRKEYVGKSIEEAQLAEGKRKVQRYEAPDILEKATEDKKTFNELTSWYLDLSAVKKLRSYPRVKQCLTNFNKSYGDLIISKIKPVDLEEYQSIREDAGISPATIDMELSIAKTMINKAFDNDIISGRVLKAFRSYNRKLKRGSNARKRVIDTDEYSKLILSASPHLVPILIVAYNTGMRLGEIRKLRWEYVDRKKNFIRLPKEVTKEGRPKNIPMNKYVIKTLDSIPRALHHDHVFTYKGEPITQEGGSKKAFATACKRANIPYGRKNLDGITFHDIRRTVKTNMLNAGMDKIHRDLILGHSLEGMDIHYMAPSEDDLHRAMDKYTAWLDSQLNSASVAQSVAQMQKRG